MLFARLDPKEYLVANIDVSSESECWPWAGRRNDRGYGEFRNRNLGEAMGFKKATAASRAAYWIFKEPMPKDKWVLHKCDNPACCNPNHLYLGTPQDNVDDMVSRERNSRGENRPASILTEANVREIRKLRFDTKPRVKIKNLAEMFGVSPHTIKHVVYGKAWKHIN